MGCAGHCAAGEATAEDCPCPSPTRPPGSCSALTASVPIPRLLLYLPGKSRHFEAQRPWDFSARLWARGAMLLNGWGLMDAFLPGLPAIS